MRVGETLKYLKGGGIETWEGKQNFFKGMGDNLAPAICAIKNGWNPLSN